jgi:hypothetical protein
MELRRGRRYQLRVTPQTGSCAGRRPGQAVPLGPQPSSYSAALIRSGATLTTGAPLDITTLRSQLQTASTQLAALTANSTVSLPGSQPANDNSAALIVINVSGSSATFNMGNMGGSFLNAAIESKMIWNFHQAGVGTGSNDDITIGREFQGSFLAPFADVEIDGTGNGFNGSVVAKSLEMRSQAHSPLFAGALPADPSSTDDTYTVRLSRQPSGNIVVQLQANGRAQLTSTDARFDDSIDRITFSPTNWYIPVVIRVSADANAPPTGQTIPNYPAVSPAVRGPVVINQDGNGRRAWWCRTTRWCSRAPSCAARTTPSAAWTCARACGACSREARTTGTSGGSTSPAWRHGSSACECRWCRSGQCGCACASGACSCQCEWRSDAGLPG